MGAPRPGALGPISARQLPQARFCNTLRQRQSKPRRQNVRHRPSHITSKPDGTRPARDSPATSALHRFFAPPAARAPRRRCRRSHPAVPPRSRPGPSPTTPDEARPSLGCQGPVWHSNRPLGRWYDAGAGGADAAPRQHMQQRRYLGNVGGVFSLPPSSPNERVVRVQRRLPSPVPVEPGGPRNTCCCETATGRGGPRPGPAQVAPCPSSRLGRVQACSPGGRLGSGMTCATCQPCTSAPPTPDPSPDGSSTAVRPTGRTAALLDVMLPFSVTSFLRPRVPPRGWDEKKTTLPPESGDL